MSKKARITGKPYEELIYKIYKELEPYAEVHLNDKIYGISSGINREIDISIKFKVGGAHEILIIIQAKDHKKAADIKILGEFESVISDVGASKGILICSAGFSKSAKTFAKNKKIEICSAYDAMSIDWKSEIEIPAIKRKIIVATKVENEMIMPEDISGQKFTLEFTMLNGVEDRVTIDEDFINKINNNELSYMPGNYSYILPVPLKSYFFKYGKVKTEIPNNKTIFYYRITHRYYFRFLKPDNYRGIKNYVSDEFIPSHVQINDEKDLFDNDEWQYIGEPEKVPYYNNCILVEHLSLMNITNTIKYDGFKAIWMNNGKQKDVLKEDV